MGDAPDDEVPEGSPGRRRFLKIATCAIGGGIGLVVTVPAVTYLLDPVGRRVVTTGDEPIDLIGIDELKIGAAPVKVTVVARSVRDAWATSTDVPLGAVWLTRTGDLEVVAFSSICPHLGCAVGFDAASQHFKCPCHDSAFGADGAYITGPSERGLDSLEASVDPKERRVSVRWVRYRQGGSEKVPV
jgi:menaquinol-cytochrome c reductase iron-sulfur subunit